MATDLGTIKAQPNPQTATLMSLTESVTDTNLEVDVQGVEQISIQSVYTDATPGAKSFVAANVKTSVQSPASSIAITAHGFVTGLKVALTGTNLPTGLSATNYWVIKIDADTISLASSLANAVAGTKVTITGAGTTADAALTPAALGSSTFACYGSNDNSNWVALTSMTVAISAAGTSLFRLGSPDYRYLQLRFTAPVAGALTISAIANVRKTNINGR
jgi:hypothetical protein